MIAGLIAIGSSALFAVSAVLARRALVGTTPLTVAFGTIVVNAAVVWVVAALAAPGPFATTSSLVFLGAGALAPGLGRIFFYRAVTLIGVGPSSIANNSTPLFVAVGAVAFLGEPLTLSLGLGTLAIILGVLAVSRPGRGTVGAAPPSPLLAGIGIAVAGALVAAVSMLLRKGALDLGVSPLVGAAWTMSGGMLVLVPAMARRLARGAWSVERRVVLTTLLSAAFSAMATIAGFVALALGEVSRVTPLQQTMPLFVAIALRVGFRDLEAVGGRTAVGATLAVAGAALILSGA